MTYIFNTRVANKNMTSKAKELERSLYQPVRREKIVCKECSGDVYHNEDKEWFCDNCDEAVKVKSIVIKGA